MPAGKPQPWLSAHRSPSLNGAAVSVNAALLHAPPSCEVKVRPVNRSVKRIGSSEPGALGALLSSQSACAGEVPSLKVTRNICVPDWYIARPCGFCAVGKLTPIDGSPEPLPRLAGAWKFWNVGVLSVPAAAGPTFCSRVTLPL